MTSKEAALVEVGDLVKAGDEVYAVTDIHKFKDGTCYFQLNNEYWEKDIWLDAIYKPNSKGDYIKVWEAQDE